MIDENMLTILAFFAISSQVVVADADGANARVVATLEGRWEAPNWSPGGTYLLLNSGGSLYRLPLADPRPVRVDTGEVNRINNDHGITPDGKTYIISAGPIYTLPATGGTPRRITEKTPSYWHGISPDGRTLVYCAPRETGGARNFDIYAIPIEGGEEQRLTTHPGYDDGPDYSPGGRWIWFNSDRAGSWDLWRMPASGAGPNDERAERMTSDEWEDWFPHPSPDGRWIVFLSFEKGTQGHPADKNVLLRRMDTTTGEIRVIQRLLGGQGTINVNSWSPDSRRFAFVRYVIVD
jgi:TolB protein